MRALAAGLPHVAASETIFEAEFDRVWELVADFERYTARVEAAVREARLVEREGDRLILDVRGPLPAIPRPGWCLMSSRLGDVGMAACPEGPGRTRYFHFEGSSLLGRLVKPLFAWNIARDFRKMGRLL